MKNIFKISFLITALFSFIIDVVSQNPSNTATGQGALFSSRDLDYIGYNTCIGFNALYNTGANSAGNTAAGAFSLYFNTSGLDNTAAGAFSLHRNTTGNYNTAAGHASLFSNTTGTQNTATGYRSLYSNTSGTNNTAAGFQSLYYNTTGSDNTASGAYALYRNIDGYQNSGTGHSVLYNNTRGYRNSGVGRAGLYNNTTGYFNSSLGVRALFGNTTGFSNTGCGDASLRFNKTGSANAALGDDALYGSDGSHNTAVGQAAGYLNMYGSFNTYLGASTGTSQDSLSNSTAIGFGTEVNSNNTVVVGNEAIRSIRGQVNWTTLSDLRAKTNIKTSELGLAFILMLKPITYNYLEPKEVSQNAKRQNEVDAEDAEKAKRPAIQTTFTADPTRYTGLGAQDVDDAAKSLGVNDFSGVDKVGVENGGLYGLRYEVLTMPLIKAIQELNKKIQDLEEELTDLRQTNATKSGDIGEKAELFQNSPNPFSTATTIRYTLPSSVKQAVLNIYDMSGKPVKSMTLAVGQNEVRFEPNALAVGMYIYTLIADGKEIATKRMILTQN